MNIVGKPLTAPINPPYGLGMGELRTDYLLSTDSKQAADCGSLRKSQIERMFSMARASFSRCVSIGFGSFVNSVMEE